MCMFLLQGNNGPVGSLGPPGDRGEVVRMLILSIYCVLRELMLVLLGKSSLKGPRYFYYREKF